MPGVLAPRLLCAKLLPRPYSKLAEPLLCLWTSSFLDTPAHMTHPPELCLGFLNKMSTHGPQESHNPSRTAVRGQLHTKLAVLVLVSSSLPACLHRESARDGTHLAIGSMFPYSWPSRLAWPTSVMILKLSISTSYPLLSLVISLALALSL